MRVVIDLGFPWGTIVIKEFPAACDDDNHFFHPGCDPLWEEKLPPNAVILDGPFLVDGDWRVLVAVIDDDME